MKYYAHTHSDPTGKSLYTFAPTGASPCWQGTGDQFSAKHGRKFSAGDLAEVQAGWQPLEEHLENVSSLAAGFVRCIGLKASAAALGWLHDLGKYNPEFQRYLRGLRGKGEDTRHAIHGATLLLGRSDCALVQAIAGHHAGLYDWSLLKPCVQKFKADPTLRTAFAAWQQEIGRLPDMSKEKWVDCPDAEVGLRQRLLFSALVDADRLDTEAHQHQDETGGAVRGPTMSIAEMAARLEARLGEMSAEPSGSTPSELARLRQQISDDAFAKTRQVEKPGVFSLTVPTGGGKTLASLRFALQHALKQKFERVIYVIPFTSIIEQNAKVFAGIFGAENVLEHHSLASWRSAKDKGENDDDESEDTLDPVAAQKRLAAENWDASLIVTTNVQFFESLFSHRPSPCRKLHRLLNSVIIFDECQAFPPGLLDPTLRQLRALAALGRTSLVLCTATQPAFKWRPSFQEGFKDCEEIMPNATLLSRQPPFRRTRMAYNSSPRTMENLCSEISWEPRALAIFNTRRDAARAFQLLRDGPVGEQTEVFHLSTLLCPLHRQHVMARIRTLLDTPGARLIVVSTQLIEAGVDIDFPVVYRALGPLDSMIQAAGRCNRAGTLTDRLGELKIFRLEEESVPKGIYQIGRDKALPFLERIGDAPQVEPALITEYFSELYALTRRDLAGIAHFDEARKYRTIGEEYRWIEGGTQSVVTDYSEEGVAVLAELHRDIHAPPKGNLLRRLGPLSINLRASDIKQGLADLKIAQPLPNGLLVTQGSYDPVLGYTLAEEPSINMFCQ